MRSSGILLFVVACFLIFSDCTRSIRNTYEEPADLIPRDTMVHIIVDLRLMDAIINNPPRRNKPGKIDMKYYLNNSIMTKYNITREQFDNSFYYYENDLKVLDEIYAEAITKLTLMKGDPDEE